jgi:hypothetical protein
MAELHRVLSKLLDDEQITVNEVALIREHIERDGRLDLDDVKFLVELLSGAKQVCPEFDELFFPILKEVILQDGRIAQDEQFYLLKMLYADGHLRDSERRFLEELRDGSVERTPQFEALCEEALLAPATNWDVGGAR